MNCIIVDDEPYAVAILADYVQKMPSLNLMNTFEDGLQALQFLRENKVDLIFLDIQMPELTGIQLLKVMVEKPQVILTTAYNQYALESYDLNVTDYLLKPVPFERFCIAVEKALARKQTPEKVQMPVVPVSVKSNSEDCIFVRTENRIQRISLTEILYVEGMKDYLRIVTSAEKVMTLLSFVKLSEMLPSEEFVRVHKSFVIPLNKVECIERNHIKIRDKYIPIGETYRPGFYSLLQEKKLL